MRLPIRKAALNQAAGQHGRSSGAPFVAIGASSEAVPSNGYSLPEVPGGRRRWRRERSGERVYGTFEERFAAVVLHHGQSLRRLPGNEPVAFLSGPLAEPVLDDDYTLLSALVSRVNSRDDGLRSRRQTRCSRWLPRLLCLTARIRHRCEPWRRDTADGVQCRGRGATDSEWDRMLARASTVRRALSC